MNDLFSSLQRLGVTKTKLRDLPSKPTKIYGDGFSPPPLLLIRLVLSEYRLFFHALSTNSQFRQH